MTSSSSRDNPFAVSTLDDAQQTADDTDAQGNAADDEDDDEATTLQPEPKRRKKKKKKKQQDRQRGAVQVTHMPREGEDRRRVDIANLPQGLQARRLTTSHGQNIREVEEQEPRNWDNSRRNPFSGQYLV